jgi:hypothetical protein
MQTGSGQVLSAVGQERKRAGERITGIPEITISPKMPTGRLHARTIDERIGLPSPCSGGLFTGRETLDFNRVQQRSTPLLPNQIKRFSEAC